MRFTKEFKLECVRKYKAGERLDDPGGRKRHTFMGSVHGWARIYDALGEIAFLRYFGVNTIWYLQSHLVCDRLDTSPFLSGII